MPSLSDLLMPQVVLDVVSRIRKGQGRLSRWLGLHFTGYDGMSTSLTGPALIESPTRYGTYRVFDRTRTAAMARAPDTGPATWQPQPIGEVKYSIPRFHERLRFDMEQLAHLSRVIGPNSQLDPQGTDYVNRQEEFLAQRQSNAIECMVAGLIRGHMYFKNAGDDWIPTLTAPSAGVPQVDINWQVPSGNTGQLNMLGAGNIIGTSWDNAAAPIISNDLPKIVDAYARLTGYAIEDAWCDPLTWGKIITNTEVKNTAGSSNTVFEKFEYVKQGGDGTPYPEWVAVLRGYPTIRWHLLSEYIIVDGGTDPTYSAGTGTLTPIIPANSVLFTPPPDSEWLDMLWYGEFVSEQVGMPAAKKPAYWMWTVWNNLPTTVELITLLNALPRLRIPKALVLATAIF